MREARISVIIPVYNVKPYLRRCLDSVTGQTYEDLEIILVDDGSTDSSEAICDEYAARDGRIRVIHKENGGLSSACNAGLAAAAGEWVGWVDSDDWVERDMFGYMLRAALEHDADVAVCSRHEWHRSQKVFRGWTDSLVLNKEQALQLLLEDAEMQNYRWDKLWKRSFFQDISFPEGRTFEDVSVMYKLFEKAEKVVCLPEPKYNYILRPNSISGSASLKNRMDHYLAVRMRYDDMIVRWPQFREQLERQCIISAMGIWSSYLQYSREERKQYKEELRDISQSCRQWRRAARENTSLGPTGRMLACLIPYTSWWSFALAGFCGRLYKLKHGRTL